ncbi:MAG: molybdopterin biosynthesis protein MoeY [Rhodocyclales bacterium]|nr:molybdopterin biosynthesis protein MoeY [Rhodocyclales bacterium]
MTPPVLKKLLQLALWAPSGDNTQPFTFEILAPDRVRIHGADTRDWCLYDYKGHASHMAHGALLETLRIAATGEGLEAHWSLVDDNELHPIYEVVFEPCAGLSSDPLLPFIEKRVVQRRPMKTTPLPSAPGEGYSVQLFESWSERLHMANLLWRNAYLRLTCPEAYPVHKEIIEWRARYSQDRIPEQAVGVDPVTARLMEWVMAKWERVQFFNRFLGGTIAPRIQLDWIPALACAAHVLVKADKPPVGLRDHVQAGVALQRVWLTATAQGLYLQPEMTPLIFRWYARSGERFSAQDALNTGASALAGDIERLGGFGQDQALVFLGRVGRSRPPHSRSTRKDVESLMVRTSG